MCAPVASTARARDQDRKFRSASTTIPGPKDGSRSSASVCSPVPYRPNAAPVSAPVPDSAAVTHRTCGNAPSRPAVDGRRRTRRSPRCPARRSWTRPWRSPAARSRTPPAPRRRRPARPGGQTACAAGQRPACPGPATARTHPAAATGGRPRVHPAIRVQLAGQQVRSAAAVVQPVGQLGHHLPVAAVPAPEQPQCQDEVHDQTGRQQPAADLPGSRRPDHLIHQIRRERPGQHPDRDPVRQPPVRRQPLSTIMSHKTVTLSQQYLKATPLGGACRRGHGPCHNLLR